jgi:UTP--glucose-1-phosphate uridylyltransferase
MRVTKAIIPVAGLGTRMLPATKAIPKEMLPVFDRPSIQYVVQEAIDAGIKEIILVTRAGKSSIEDHFDQNSELVSLLRKKGNIDLAKSIESTLPADVTISSVRQSSARGLGDAVLCAKEIIGDAPFVVLLPDVLIDEFNDGKIEKNLSYMLKAYEKSSQAQVMVEKVPMECIHQYGVVGLMDGKLQQGESRAISTIVEKPAQDNAPSDLAIVGRYVFGASFWPLLESVVPDCSGEIQLTDAIHALIQQETVKAYHIVGQSHDCGNKFGWVKATVEYALRDEQVGDLLKAYFYNRMNFYDENKCIA